MNAGKVEQIGTPAEVYDQPASSFVHSFLGSVNLFRGRVAGQGLGIGEQLLGGPISPSWRRAARPSPMCGLTSWRYCRRMRRAASAPPSPACCPWGRASGWNCVVMGIQTVHTSKPS